MNIEKKHQKSSVIFFLLFLLIIAIVGCLIIYIEIKKERKRNVLKNEALSPMDNEE